MFTAVSLAAVAVHQSPGATATTAHLHESGVWVSAPGRSSVGKVNSSARLIEMVVPTRQEPTHTVDVLQDGSTVVVHNESTHTLIPLNAETGVLLGAAKVTATAPQPMTSSRVFPGTTVDMRGGTIATITGERGQVRMTTYVPGRPIPSLDAVGDGAPAYAEVGAGGSIAVGTDGSVYAVSSKTGRVVTFARRGSIFAEPTEAQVPPTNSQFQITAVGRRWVVFDPHVKKLYAAGLAQPADVSLGGDTANGEPGYAALQVPGPGAPFVVMQDEERAETVEIGDGADTYSIGTVPKPQDDNAPPIVAVSRPVVHNRCINAVWGHASGNFFGRNCGTEKAPIANILDGTKKRFARGTRWEVNGTQLLMDDLDTGAVYDPDLTGGMRVDSWDDTTPPPGAGS